MRKITRGKDGHKYVNSIVVANEDIEFFNSKISLPSQFRRRVYK
jgi:hypothetical protein